MKLFPPFCLDIINLSVLAALVGAVGVVAGQEGAMGGGPTTYALARKANYVPLQILREAGSRIPAPLARSVSVQRDSALLQQVLLDIANPAELGLSYGEDLVRAHVLVSLHMRSDTGAIVGRVTDGKTQTPLVGATVVVEGTRHSATTGSDGWYRMADVAPGTYTLRVRYVGYAPGSTTVTVSEAQEAIADLVLQPLPTRLGEVVVTAEKHEERLIDVPISIVAMGADELQTRKVTNIDDLSFAVPGLLVSSSGSFQRDIQIRGVSNVTGSLGSSMVGLYLDEASVTSGRFFQPDLRTYDLERVEVLRGPQGTLFGEGSVGGTIRFISKHPVLDRFAMTGDVAGLFTAEGAPGQRIEGALNVPLIKNELGLRVAGTFDHGSGWMNQPATGRAHFNGQDLVDMRVKGLWQPAPQLKVNAMAVIHRNDAPPDLGEDLNGNYTQAFNLTTTPSNTDNYDLYNLTLTYDFPVVRVLSTTGYLKQDREARNLGAQFQLTPPGTPAYEEYIPLWTSGSKVFTEEFRLTSIGSGPWQWTIGGYYRHARFDDDMPGYLFGVPGPPGTPLPDPFSSATSTLSQSSAAFGDVRYQLTGRLTLGTGLRYFHDDQEQTDGSGPTTTIQRGEFHALSPRFYAQYKVTDRVNTYASVVKGFRSGGFNQLNQPNYGPENVWTYELGTKMSLAGGRLSADAAIFYTDYGDYQIFANKLVGGTVTYIISNAGSARITGVEWGLTCYLGDQWSLSFNGDYVDSRFYQINATPAAYDVGDPLGFSPRYGYAVSAQRDFKLNGRRGFARLDYNEHGHATFRDRTVGPWFYEESPIVRLLNFNAGLQLNNNWSVGLFAQNLLDDRGFLSPGSIYHHAARPRPRTFGVGFGVTF